MSTDQPTGEGFSPDRTCEGLQEALQQSRAARMQYLTSARACEEADLYVLSHALCFCADQEKEHAELLTGLLALRGAALPEAPADVPGLPADPAAMLQQAALAGEERGSVLWPAHARAAREAGDARAAMALERMATTELLHARRFRQYAGMLQEGSLFHSPERVGWLCLPCGHRHYGPEAPERCSACGRSRGHFIRGDFRPFAVSAR